MAASSFRCETDAEGTVATSTYDANNNRVSVTRTVNGQPEILTTQMVYDRNNRVTQTTAPDGAITRTTYNQIGKVATSVDAVQRPTSYTYDTNGRLTRTTYDAENRTT